MDSDGQDPWLPCVRPGLSSATPRSLGGFSKHMGSGPYPGISGSGARGGTRDSLVILGSRSGSWLRQVSEGRNRN